MPRPKFFGHQAVCGKVEIVKNSEIQAVFGGCYQTIVGTGLTPTYCSRRYIGTNNTERIKYGAFEMFPGKASTARAGATTATC